MLSQAPFADPLVSKVHFLWGLALRDFGDPAGEALMRTALQHHEFQLGSANPDVQLMKSNLPRPESPATTAPMNQWAWHIATSQRLGAEMEQADRQLDHPSD